jgi:hypothetical protein
MSIMEQYTWDQQLGIIVASKISSSLSFLSSSYIVHSIITDDKRRKRTKDRLIMSMSVFDILYSLANFVGTWAFPSENIVSVRGSIGTDLTCDIEGFLMAHSGSSVLMYNMAMAFYFLLVVKFNYTDSKMKRLEPYFHFICIVYPLIGAILAVVFDAIHPKGLLCLVAMNDENCAPEDEQCLNNEARKVFILLFYSYALPLFLAIPIGAVTMLTLYCHVRHIEGRMQRYAGGSSVRASKAVAEQGAMYMIALLLTWVPALIHNLFLMVSQGRNPSYVWQLVTAITNPLQGTLQKKTAHHQ